MEHKAYQFDYGKFEQELDKILFNALASKQIIELRKFINENLTSIKSPWEGEFISEDWEDFMEVPDEHNYGDLAITKYYDPALDKGLGDLWLDLPEQLTNRNAYFLGKTFGPRSNIFDPAKYGSYFIKNSDLQSYINNVSRLIQDDSYSDYHESFENYVQFLFNAREDSKGIFVTF